MVLDSKQDTVHIWLMLGLIYPKYSKVDRGGLPQL